MSYEHLVRLVCDGCKVRGRPVPSHEPDPQPAPGWLTGNLWGTYVHLCPHCAARPLPEWWPDSTGTRFHLEEEEDAT